MESVLRGIIVYFFLFIILRICGKRAIQTTTPFGLILIFLISSCVADALKGEDRSVINSFILVATLASVHMILSHLKIQFRGVEKVMNDIPALLVTNGELHTDRMKRARVTEDDILAAARMNKIGYISEIKYALLEIDGSICIIPKKD